MKDTPGIASSISMRSRVVQAVHSPLGFFVLALLIVETFLLGAGIWFGLPDKAKLWAIAIGVLMFLIVFGIVVWLVVKYPQNLVFSEESHVQIEQMKIFGMETHSMTGYDLNILPKESVPVPPAGQLPASNGRTQK